MRPAHLREKWCFRNETGLVKKVSFLKTIQKTGRLLFVILPVFILGLSACPSGRESATVIEFWAMGVEAQHLGQLTSGFEKENPGLRVHIQAIPWSAAHEKLLTAYAGRSTPDLCQLGNTWIPEFVTLNALEPLHDYVKSTQTIDPADYFAGIWATNEIGESLFGIPWYVDTRLLYYRKDIFAEFGYATAPKAWTELFDLALKIQKAHKTDYAFYLPLNGWHEVVAMAMQNGSGLLRDNDSYGDFSAPEFQNALRFFLKWYDNKLCPLGMNTISNLYQSFAENYFAIYISGPWNLGEFQKRLPANMQAKWAVAPMPSFSSEYPGISTAGGSSIVMFRNSANRTAAWKLIEFLSRPENQARFYELSGDLPANKKAWDRTNLHANEKTEAFYRQLQRVQPAPRIPEWEQIALKIQQHVEIMAYGKMSPVEVGERLNSEIDRLLEKRRWLLQKEQP